MKILKNNFDKLKKEEHFCSPSAHACLPDPNALPSITLLFYIKNLIT